jgi:hypothetical protein
MSQTSNSRPGFQEASSTPFRLRYSISRQAINQIDARYFWQSRMDGDWWYVVED